MNENEKLLRAIVILLLLLTLLFIPQAIYYLKILESIL